MRIALLGATGTIGSAVLARARDEGHELKVLVRRRDSVTSAAGVNVINGDALRAADVASVLEGVELAISAVGPRTNGPDSVAMLEAVARNVVAAMRQHGVPRVVFVAGAGVALPGERRSLVQSVATSVVRLFARWVVAAKEREMEIYRESGLDWRAVRPTRVRPGPPTGRVQLSDERPTGFIVTSGDVADAILRLARDPHAARRAPFVSTGRKV